jgi:hypothetical protein
MAKHRFICALFNMVPVTISLSVDAKHTHTQVGLAAVFQGDP